MCVGVLSLLVNGTQDSRESKAPPARRSQGKEHWNWVPVLPLPPCVTVSQSQTLRALQFSQLWNGAGVRLQEAKVL